LGTNSGEGDELPLTRPGSGEEVFRVQNTTKKRRVTEMGPLKLGQLVDVFKKGKPGSGDKQSGWVLKKTVGAGLLGRWKK